MSNITPQNVYSLDNNLDQVEIYQVVQVLKRKYWDKANIIHQANEAKTRLLLVDEILVSLGWPREEFNPEYKVGHLGYTDYLLTAQGIPRLIVEAKRESYTFASPTNQNRRNHYQLKYLRSAFGPALGDIINQAESYAVETKVPFAVLTNGMEWILAQLRIIPGFESFEELNAIYFGNILSDQFNFELMWQLLSYENVAAGNLEVYFANLNIRESDHVVIPATKLGEFDWRLSTDDERVREFYDMFFDEIIDPGRRNMLTHCFVTNSRLDQYDKELQRTLRDSAPDYMGEAKDISPEDGKLILGIHTGDQKGRVVIVAGSVGCGKSTFVTKALLDARRNDRLLDTTVNLIDEVEDNPREIVILLWKYLEKAWRETSKTAYTYNELRSIFNKEIARLKEGSYTRTFDENSIEYQKREADLLEKLSKDPETYFPACWRYYRNRNQGIVLFMDNVDRTSENFQKQAYNFAHKLAANSGATIIITMREFTFFRGREAGFLDVRSSDLVFHLQAPNLIQLISKRIKYIEEHLHKDFRLSQWKRRQDWSILESFIQKHASTLKTTFLTSSSGTELIKVLDATAWHDIRYFLQLLRQVHLILGNNSYSWSIHKLLAVLMTPMVKRGYSPVISNIFRPAYPAYQNYFLKLRILLMLQYGHQVHETRRGIGLEQIVTLMYLYGYQRQWCNLAMQELVRERFVECVEAPAAEDHTKNYIVVNSHTFRPSPLAVILLQKLLTIPVYLVLIGNTLPFHNPKMAERYAEILKDLYTTLDEGELEPDAIDILLDTDLQIIIARYLVGEYKNEAAPTNLRKHIPEMTVIEFHLEKLVDVLGKFSGIERNSLQAKISTRQLRLFTESSTQVQRDFSRIPIPSGILEKRLGKSEQAPLIFWALVALKVVGQEWADGTEITHIINDYLVDDYHKKESNNISRALRSRSLQLQPWLKIKESGPRKKYFGLTEEWRKVWKDAFAEELPQF